MERALIALAVFAALSLATVAVRRYIERRRTGSVARLRGDGASDARRMRILYFTTPTCVECRHLQKPALAELERRFGPELSIDTIDAIEERELARKYRVLTVPTTAVFDAAGRLVDINYGYAPADRLALQLTGATTG